MFGRPFDGTSPAGVWAALLKAQLVSMKSVPYIPDVYVFSERPALRDSSAQGMRTAGFKLFPDEVEPDEIGDSVVLWSVDGDGLLDPVKYEEAMALGLRAALSCVAPMPFARVWDEKGRQHQQVYLFGRKFWYVLAAEQILRPDELRLLFLQAHDADRKKFDRLKNKFSGQAGEPTYKREPIAEDVQIFVWRRDDGRCVKCGERENLEFDHIIPVSCGGSSTGRNIQLLCEGCNREKSNHIGG